MNLIIRYKKDIIDFLKFTLIGLAIVIVVRAFVLEPYRILGKSMYPLFDGIGEERVVIWKLGDYERGDIVVARPQESGQKIIKRVIALPGEKVQIRDGAVFVNNQSLDEPYLADGIYTSSPSTDIIILKDDQYFLVGDNRVASQDSRRLGPLSKSEIVGKSAFQYYPFSEFRTF